MFDWLKEWQMEFNVEKCKVMHIRYFMDQKQLEVVKEEKDLGVVITNDLKASHQCTAAGNKANRILGMINRTIVYKSKEVCSSCTNRWYVLMLNIVLQCGHLARKTRY